MNRNTYTVADPSLFVDKQRVEYAVWLLAGAEKGTLSQKTFAKDWTNQ